MGHGLKDKRKGKPTSRTHQHPGQDAGPAGLAYSGGSRAAGPAFDNTGATIGRQEYQSTPRGSPAGPVARTQSRNTTATGPIAWAREQDNTATGQGRPWQPCLSSAQPYQATMVNEGPGDRYYGYGRGSPLAQHVATAGSMSMLDVYVGNVARGSDVGFLSRIGQDLHVYSQGYGCSDGCHVAASPDGDGRDCDYCYHCENGNGPGPG